MKIFAYSCISHMIAKCESCDSHMHGRDPQFRPGVLIEINTWSTCLHNYTVNLSKLHQVIKRCTGTTHLLPTIKQPLSRRLCLVVLGQQLSDFFYFRELAQVVEPNALAPVHTSYLDPHSWVGFKCLSAKSKTESQVRDRFLSPTVRNWNTFAR